MTNLTDTATTKEQDRLVTDRLRSILERRQNGHGLPRASYTDEALYRLEIDEIWRRYWLFAGHSCEVPETGSYFTFELDGAPIFVVRQADGTLRTLHNVCRHRGSIIVVDDAGKNARFTCPYHGWIYDLDGTLLRCQGAPAEFSKEDHGLRSLHVEEIAGLVFVSYAKHPFPIAAAAAELAGLGTDQGLANAKIVRQIRYSVAANWKLIWENNRECFHCDLNHPQYVKANFDRYDISDLRHEDDFATAVEKNAEALATSDIDPKLFEGFGLTTFPSAREKVWWSANRTVLQEGFLSETVDGSLVSTLMGNYRDPGVGTLRLRTLPNFWCHASCDHAVTTRIVPTGIDTTELVVSWLVDAHADESQYDVERMLPFWQLTSEQDWLICERQQRGVTSTGYVPGPLSPVKETNVDAWISWYVDELLARLDER